MTRCESLFWQSRGMASSLVDEPVAAVTGLLMIPFGVFGDGGLAGDPGQPLPLCMVRAGLVFVGLGTVAYHVITDAMEDWLANRNMYDAVTMAVLTSSLFCLYWDEWLGVRHKLLAVFLAFGFVIFWVILNDWGLNRHLREKLAEQQVSLSNAVLFPPWLVMNGYVLWRVVSFYGFAHSLHAHFPLWTALLVGVVCWAVYETACPYAYGLFFLHAVWHVLIAYSVMYAGILGVVVGFHGDFQLVPGQSPWWPKVMRTGPDGFRSGGFLQDYRRISYAQ